MRSRPLLAVLAAGAIATALAPQAHAIACTEAAFEQALASCSNGQTITFDCPAGTVIPLSATRFNSRILSCSNVTIDGGNKVTFDMNPKWWDVAPSFCSTGDCDPDGNNVPNACPDVNDSGSDMWFVRLNGANSTVRNLTYRYFMEGVRLAAAGSVIDGVVGEYPGDDIASNYPGYNIEIRNSTFRNACDKMLHFYGNEPLGGSAYDVRMIDTVVENAVSGIRTTGAGRFYVEGSTFRDSNPPSSLFQSNGPFLNDTDVPDPAAVYWKDNLVTGTKRGVRVSGAVHFISLGGNVFSNNGRRGVSVYTNARALFQNDRFEGNGGTSTSETCSGYGGIAVCNAAQVDAGGGGLTLDGAVRTSTGGNVFLGNRGPADSTLDLENLTTGSVRAENNWWGDLDPTDQVSGTVDFSPMLQSLPTGGDTQPPSSVRTVRRTDKRPS